MGCEMVVYDFQLCHLEVSLLSGVNEKGPPEGEPERVSFDLFCSPIDKRLVFRRVVFLQTLRPVWPR